MTAPESLCATISALCAPRSAYHATRSAPPVTRSALSAPGLLLPRSDLPQGCPPRPYPQQHHQRHLQQRQQQKHPSPCLPHNIIPPHSSSTFPHLPLLPSSSYPTSSRTNSGTSSRTRSGTNTGPTAAPTPAQQRHQQQDHQRHQYRDQHRQQQQYPRPILLLPFFPPTLISMASSDSSVGLASVDQLELLTDNTAANWHPYTHSVEVLLSSVVISGYNLRSVVFQEGGGLQFVAPTAPTGPVPTHPGAEPSPVGDSPQFAPNVNDPQSSETAIRTYHTNLQEHLRQKLRYEDEKRIYDDAAARYGKYLEDLDTFNADLADYTTKITAWRVADRCALALLLATIPSSLKRELSPTSSSHLW
ncbi:unnamed protein product [Closterium sp. NIES-54]